MNTLLRIDNETEALLRKRLEDMRRTHLGLAEAVARRLEAKPNVRPQDVEAHNAAVLRRAKRLSMSNLMRAILALGVYGLSDDALMSHIAERGVPAGRPTKVEGKGKLRVVATR